MKTGQRFLSPATFFSAFAVVAAVSASSSLRPCFAQGTLAQPPLMVQPGAAAGVVVRFDGEDILFKSIEMTPDEVRARQKADKVAITGDVATQQAAYEKSKHEYERKRLSKLILDRMYPVLIKEFGVTVADSEVDGIIQALTAQMNIQEQLTTARKGVTDSLNALKAVYAGKETSQSSYNKWLSKQMTLAAWETMIVTYRTPGKLQELEANTKMTVGQYLDSLRASEKGKMEERKVQQKVLDLLSAQDVKFKNDVSIILSGIQSPAYIAAKEYILKTRNEWWMKKYEQHMTIVDPAFGDVFLDLL